MVYINCLAASQPHSYHLSQRLSELAWRVRNSLQFLSLVVAILCLFLSSHIQLEATQPADLTARDTQHLMSEMMSSHPTYKELNPVLVQRILRSYCEELDPAKVYFLQKDIEHLINPTLESVQKIQRQLQRGSFDLFSDLLKLLSKRIEEIQKLNITVENQSNTASSQLEINKSSLGEKKEGKYIRWPQAEDERLYRLKDIYRLQNNAILLLKTEDQRERAKKALQKMRTQFEKDLTPPLNSALFEKTVLTLFMKSFARSLDSQTMYFTPFEAKQFMIHVQQKLSGIGVLLRDDFDGLTITKVIEGGPSDRSQLIRVNDKIIAINNEPVIGMGLEESVEMIRGDVGTQVLLTILRKNESGEVETKDVRITRDEVKVSEERFSSIIEPYKDGSVMVSLKLNSFYQDEKDSSYEDLLKHLLELQQRYTVRGIILDLRDNPGGILAQAVSVAGLFMDKGIVVSIKDEKGTVYHMRNIDSTKVWDGPLLVCINKASASAAEIVAQALQDWGRALVIGDETSFGKGSFQVFTLNPDKSKPNPKGEYKITRGRYYTVSGKSPQLVGVRSDIVIPGPYSFFDIGEKFLDYPLGEDSIAQGFKDTFDDLPFYQRPFARSIYKDGMQVRENSYQGYLNALRDKSLARQSQNAGYQLFLGECKKEADRLKNDNVENQLDSEKEIVEEVTGQEPDPTGGVPMSESKVEALSSSSGSKNKDAADPELKDKEKVDYQLLEAWNIMRDVIDLETSIHQAAPNS